MLPENHLQLWNPHHPSISIAIHSSPKLRPLSNSKTDSTGDIILSLFRNGHIHRPYRFSASIRRALPQPPYQSALLHWLLSSGTFVPTTKSHRCRYLFEGANWSLVRGRSARRADPRTGARDRGGVVNRRVGNTASDPRCAISFQATCSLRSLRAGASVDGETEA